MTAAVVQWEWAILLLLILGLAVAELLSVRRSIRRAARTKPEGRPDPRT